MLEPSLTSEINYTPKGKTYRLFCVQHYMKHHFTVFNINLTGRIFFAVLPDKGICKLFWLCPFIKERLSLMALA